MDSKTFSGRLGIFSRLLTYIGAAALFLMMCLTTVDVIGRYLFNTPILGTLEMTEFLVLIVVFSFLAYTQSEKSHVSVDLVVLTLPAKVRGIIWIVNSILCFLLMAIITWRGVDKALELKEIGETSPNLMVPNYPFVFFLVLGCGVLCVEYFRDIMDAFRKRKEGPAS